jgi:hypothetical protein
MIKPLGSEIFELNLTLLRIFIANTRYLFVSLSFKKASTADYLSDVFKDVLKELEWDSDRFS